MREMRRKVPYFLAFILALSLVSGCAVIESGYVGVKKSLGKVSKDELMPGAHFYIPIVQSIIPFEVRVKKIDFKGRTLIVSLTKDGLTVSMEMTVLYRILPDMAAETYIKYGYYWDEKIVVPLVRAVSRDIATSFTSAEIYQKRTEFQSKLEELIKTRLRKENVEVQEILVRNITLPENVVKAIEEKIRAQQEAERMKFVVEKERLEAERRKIEAQGIAEAQKIIAGSLSRKYIQWKYIDTLKELVNSPNNTVIILPFDPKLIPLLQIPSIPGK